MNRLGIMEDALAGRRADDMEVMAEDYGVGSRVISTEALLPKVI